MSLRATVFDCNGQPIVLGSKVDGGNGIDGVVVELNDLRHQPVGIVVQWPDSDVPETFIASNGRVELEVV